MPKCKLVTNGETKEFKDVTEAARWIEDNLVPKDSYSYEMFIDEPEKQQFYYYHADKQITKTPRMDVV